MAYLIKWCEDLRSWRGTQFNRREVKIAAANDEEAIKIYREWVESHPENPRTPYSQPPFLERIETIATIGDLSEDHKEQKRQVAEARSEGPVSKEEALKAAERAAELDDQEGLGELAIEESRETPKEKD